MALGQLEHRISRLIALPVEAMDEAALKSRLGEIGAIADARLG